MAGSVCAAPLALATLLGVLSWPALGGSCPDEVDVEMDLCDDEPPLSHAARVSPSASVVLPVLLAGAGSGHAGAAAALVALVGLVPPASATALVTCGDVKAFYKSEGCCGNAGKELVNPPACPYDFTEPACASAEPQSPRDLSSSGGGEMVPKAATLTVAQVDMLPLANVHFHLGAEHKSDEYSDGSDSSDYDNSSDLSAGSGVRPGFMCSTDGLDATQLASYDFRYCKGQIEVGRTYEVHYVHSSAGYSAEDMQKKINSDAIPLTDGLTLAANGRGQLNPQIAVQARVYQIVQDAENLTDMLHSWNIPNYSDGEAVMYPGSTTGPSYNNSVCSPYAITWHVDKRCHRVSPEAFDNMCRMMREQYSMEADLYPHGSRELVSKSWVVKDRYVQTLA